MNSSHADKCVFLVPTCNEGKVEAQIYKVGRGGGERNIPYTCMNRHVLALPIAKEMILS